MMRTLTIAVAVVAAFTIGAEQIEAQHFGGGGYGWSTHVSPHFGSGIGRAPQPGHVLGAPQSGFARHATGPFRGPDGVSRLGSRRGGKHAGAARRGGKHVGGGGGFGGFYPVWLDTYHPYSFDRPQMPPYFAMYPPVYYSDQIVRRPVGVSPYAVPPGTIPVEMQMLPTETAERISNPFFNPQPQQVADQKETQDTDT
ncbi:MAG: hypothetical protein ACR2NP_11235 [Pirellulaceae bacterium]